MKRRRRKITINGKEIKKEDIQRFWNRVKIGDKDECWEWQAGKNSNTAFSYGCFYVNGKGCLTHRLSLSLHLNKTLGKETEVMHLCDNPLCCNPFHLKEATHLENMRDMYTKNRRKTEKGEERYNAKLTEEKVKKIRKLYGLREKYKKYNLNYLADKYGVDRTLIGKIVKGTAWKHVK
jgi:hypothetical protein